MMMMMIDFLFFILLLAYQAILPGSKCKIDKNSG